MRLRCGVRREHGIMGVEMGKLTYMKINEKRVQDIGI